MTSHIPFDLTHFLVSSNLAGFLASSLGNLGDLGSLKLGSLIISTSWRLGDLLGTLTCLSPERKEDLVLYALTDVQLNYVWFTCRWYGSCCANGWGLIQKSLALSILFVMSLKTSSILERSQWMYLVHSSFAHLSLLHLFVLLLWKVKLEQMDNKTMEGLPKTCQLHHLQVIASSSTLLRSVTSPWLRGKVLTIWYQLFIGWCGLVVFFVWVLAGL